MIHRYGTAALTFVLLAALTMTWPAQAQSKNGNGGGNQDCPAGTELLAKYEIDDDGTFVFEDKDGTSDIITFSNLETKEDEPNEIIAGDWSSTEPISVVIVKGSNNSKLLGADNIDESASDGTFTTESLGNPQPGLSNIQFCGSTTCPASTFEESVNEDEQQVTLTISNTEGITSVNFTTLTNFTIFSSPDDFNNASGNEWTFEDDEDAPTSVEFVLQAEAPDGNDGEFDATYFAEVESTCGTTFLDPPHAFATLSATAEEQTLSNYPNPFREATTVRVLLNDAAPVTVAVYNIMGRRVATLVQDRLEAGIHDLTWNGHSDEGQSLASGIYFVRLEAGDRTITRRITRVR